MRILFGLAATLALLVWIPAVRAEVKRFPDRLPPAQLAAEEAGKKSGAGVLAKKGKKGKGDSPPTKGQEPPAKPPAAAPADPKAAELQKKLEQLQKQLEELRKQLPIKE